MNRRNIGIFAPVDAGKTTLTERLLNTCGVTKTMGSVDNGTTVTDTLDVEKRRGISVVTNSTSFFYNDILINLLDTPGHVDFAAQVERALYAIDSAILVFSACDELPAYGRQIFTILKNHNIPTIIFLNKTDRPIADIELSMNRIKAYLTKNAVLSDGFGKNISNNIYEALADIDNDILNNYLSDKPLDYDYAVTKIKTLTANNKIVPVISGSAIKGAGINDLLKAIELFIPEPIYKPELSGIVYGIKENSAMGRGACIRLFGGELEIRQTMKLEDITAKITQISSVPNSTLQETGKAQAGELALVYGFSDAKVGDIIGNKTLLPKNAQPQNIKTPLMSVSIKPVDDKNLPLLRKALNILNSEDPFLALKWSAQEKKFILSIMGNIQLEILKETLPQRFGIDVLFDEPMIIYKETPAKKAIGKVRYTMPKPCWAVIVFEIIPLKNGSGVKYECDLPKTAIPIRYRKQIEQTIPKALKQGRLGWEVTDVLICLIDGEDHLEHTHPLDFVVATPMALMDGLEKAGSILLEPILQIDFTVPTDCIGKLMSDIIAMRGSFEDPVNQQENTLLKAYVPASESMEYNNKLASYTSGKGVMIAKLNGYKPCPEEYGHTAKRRSIDPLDKSKYILAARSALESNIFD